MDDIYKRTRAKIDLSKMIHNFKCIRKELKPETAVMSIVKADAYGHDAELVSRELEALGTEYFGVSSIDEALQLRQANIKTPILILGYTCPSSYHFLFDYDITQTVFSYEEALLLSEETKKQGKKLTVHLKVDTGMSRLGFLLSNETEYHASMTDILKALQLEGLIFEGIFTHFAESELEDSEYTKQQFSIFIKAIDDLKEQDYTFRYRHCCNSGAIINYPEMHLDMVRPGIILYGLYPNIGMRSIGLLPAMELLSVISQIKTFKPDTTISYNRTYCTKEDTRIAVVPIGYADGLSRTISGRADMLVNGKRARILGKVCMDMTMLDISDINDAEVGQDVTIFGTSSGTYLSVEEISKISGTISYETVCRIGKRVPRIFLKDGKEVETKSSIL